MRQQGSGTLITILGMAYILGVIGYAIYGWETGTGLSGILMEYQMRFVGSASMTITMLATMAVAAIPAVVVGLIWGARAKPGAFEPVTPARPMSTSSKWLLVTGIAIVAGLIPGAVYLWLEKTDAEDQKRTVYQMDFRKPTGAPAADAKFAQISGYRVLKQQYRFSSSSSRGSKSTKIFVPLVPAGWTPDQPVVYFYTGQITRMPDPLPVQLEATPMPVFAKSKFEQAGVKVAAQHYLLKDASIAEGKVVSWIEGYRLLPWTGLGVAFLVFFFSGVVFISQARATRRAAAESYAR